jgi:hypothetical protein
MPTAMDNFTVREIAATYLREMTLGTNVVEDVTDHDANLPESVVNNGVVPTEILLGWARRAPLKHPGFSEKWANSWNSSSTEETRKATANAALVQWDIWLHCMESHLICTGMKNFGKMQYTAKWRKKDLLRCWDTRGMAGETVHMPDFYDSEAETEGYGKRASSRT